MSLAPTDIRGKETAETSRKDAVAVLKTRLRELAVQYQDTEVVQLRDAKKKGKR